MSSVGKTLPAAASLCCLIAWQSVPHRALAGDGPALHVTLHMPFDDASLDATTAAGAIRPLRQSLVRLEHGAVGKAVRVDEGTDLAYSVKGCFPLQAGTLEFLLNPAFPQVTTEKAGVIFTLSNAKREQFRASYVPRCRGFWLGFTKGKRREGLQTHYGDLKPDAWNHVVLTWDATKQDRKPVLSLYVKGRPYAYSKQTAFTRPSQEFTELRLGADNARPVRIDEFIIYDRCLTSTQAKWVYERRHEGVRKLPALVGRVQEDLDREEARQRGIERFVAQRKIGLLTWLNGHGPRWTKLFGVLPLVQIKPETMAPADLDQFAVLLAPGGGKDDYSKEQWAAIVDFVRRGRGYVGICKGAYDAARRQLLSFQGHPFREEGITEVRLHEHPVAEGYDLSRALPMHHGNGPLMEPGPEATPVGTFNIGPREAKYSAVLAGVMPGGKGRVVVFSTHPYGGVVGHGPAGKSVHISGRELNTERLLINALLWAGRAEELAPSEK